METFPAKSNRATPQQKPSNTNASPPHSEAHLVDLTRCNQQRLLKSVTRNLVRYLACFKPAVEPTPIDRREVVTADVAVVGAASVMQSPKNCNYYSEMNDEERDEKLKSAIFYCNDSTGHDDQPPVRF